LLYARTSGLKLETAAEAAAFLLQDVGDEAGVGGSDWIRHRLTSSWILLVAVRSVAPEEGQPCP